MADIDDFAGRSLAQDVHYFEFDIRPHKTAVVKLGPKGEHFPLKERYDW